MSQQCDGKPDLRPAEPNNGCAQATPMRTNPTPLMPHRNMTDISIPIRALARHMKRPNFAATAVGATLVLGAGLVLPGCQLAALIGGAAESYKRESTHSVAPQYTGLKGKSFAVMVIADRSIDATYPGVVQLLTTKITDRLHEFGEAKGLIESADMMAFLYNNPRWSVRPRIDLARELGVDRLVVVELQEYRLHDPGNQYLWDGAAIGTIGVIEVDAAAPENYAFEKLVTVKFPDKQGTGPQEYSQDLVMAALDKRFTDRATWLFYTHEEPYYPDY